jgi:hypothetical protein
MENVDIGILSSFGIFYDHLVYLPMLWAFDNFVAIWYIFPHFCILYQEKSGIPDSPKKPSRCH